MKVDKIARLFSAQSEPALATQNQGQVSTQNLAPDAGAVKVAGTIQLQSSSATSEESSRAEKIASLKEAVQSGSYTPDSRKVALAFMQEILA
jgi:anti-sigma28 factor (negative regulator of flagellin synthesis)